MQVDVDDSLLREVRRLAEEQGRSEAEVVEDALRSYVVRPFSDPDTLFERIDRWQSERNVASFSEEDAIRLADEELHAMRQERRAGR